MYALKTDPAAVVMVGHARFTVLTPQLILGFDGCAACGRDDY